jgi:hypothetical protein
MKVRSIGAFLKHHVLHVWVVAVLIFLCVWGLWFPDVTLLGIAGLLILCCTLAALFRGAQNYQQEQQEYARTCYEEKQNLIAQELEYQRQTTALQRCFDASDPLRALVDLEEALQGERRANFWRELESSSDVKVPTILLPMQEAWIKAEDIAHAMAERRWKVLMKSVDGFSLDEDHHTLMIFLVLRDTLSKAKKRLVVVARMTDAFTSFLNLEEGDYITFTVECRVPAGPLRYEITETAFLVPKKSTLQAVKN